MAAAGGGLRQLRGLLFDFDGTMVHTGLPARS
jgi:hypothetical protein